MDGLIGLFLLGIALAIILFDWVMAFVFLKTFIKHILPEEKDNYDLKWRLSVVVAFLTLSLGSPMAFLLRPLLPFANSLAIYHVVFAAGFSALFLYLRRGKSTLASDRLIVVFYRIVIGFLFFFLFSSFLGAVSGSFNRFFNKKSDCVPGILKSIDSCDQDGESGWQNSGWYYFHSKGKIDQNFCAYIKEKAATIWIRTSNDDKSLSSFSKVPCIGITGDSSQICYTYSIRSGNGNTVYYSAAIFDSECNNGQFFTGSKYGLVDGKPKDLKFEGQPPEYTIPQ